MLVNLNFKLSGWIKRFEIEAASEQEAVDKLMSMALQEIIENDSISADAEVDITDIETSVVESTVIVEVTDIQYDFDLEEMDPAVAKYLLAKLPKELTIKVEAVNATTDEYTAIKDALSDKTMQDILDFKYKIINRV